MLYENMSRYITLPPYSKNRVGKVQLGHLIHSLSPLLQDCPLQYMHQIYPYPYLTAQAMSVHEFSSTEEAGA